MRLGQGWASGRMLAPIWSPCSEGSFCLLYIYIFSFSPERSCPSMSSCYLDSPRRSPQSPHPLL